MLTKKEFQKYKDELDFGKSTEAVIDIYLELKQNTNDNLMKMAIEIYEKRLEGNEVKK